MKDYNPENETKGIGNFKAASHPNYLPIWDTSVHLPPLEPFEHHDPGVNADPKFPHLFPGGIDHFAEDLTGNIGAEVRGLQLSQLDDKGKDELALYVAQKKVVAFYDQDFADLPIEKAKEFASHFGRLHVHPTSPAPAGHPEVHLVHRGAADKTASQFLTERTNSTAWHTDVSYEAQPPGTTFLYVLDGPTAGGDTLFSSMTEAYERLSPKFRDLLKGLKAYHSGYEQADGARARESVVRREPVAHEHPVVRTHPATGQKALYVNPQFTRKLVGFKKEESDALLKILFDHINFGQDFQCRVRWRPRTVVVWDNRVTAHSATLDWKDGQRRHIARITPQAERPYEGAEENTNGTA
ncbi:MAG: hypothetical protein Q9159_005949 [Coniocarpon cinnabarinum]